MKWLPFLILFICSTAQASTVVCFNQDNRVNFFQRSVHTPDYVSRTNCLINPVLPQARVEHWKRGGLLNDRVVEFSQAEKDALALERQQKLDDAASVSLSVRTKLATLGFTTDEIKRILFE